MSSAVTGEFEAVMTEPHFMISSPKPKDHKASF